MLKNISAVLIATITFILVFLVVCSPNMSAMQIDCPDAQMSGSSFSQRQPFSCFLLHFKGVSIFHRVIFSANILFLMVGVLAVFFLVRIVTIWLLRHIQSLFIIDHDPPFIPKKQYRWLAKQHSLYHRQYSYIASFLTYMSIIYYEKKEYIYPRHALRVV